MRLCGQLRRRLQLVFRRGDAVADGVDGPALGVYVELCHDVFDQALAVIVVVDGEAFVEAQLLAVRAQHAHAHAVERGHPHAAGGRANQAAQTLAHLRRGFVGERDCQDLPRLHAAFQHMRDAEREHARLSGTRACKNQKRPFGCKDRFALGRIEGVKVDHGRMPPVSKLLKTSRRGLIARFRAKVCDGPR